MNNLASPELSYIIDLIFDIYLCIEKPKISILDHKIMLYYDDNAALLLPFTDILRGNPFLVNLTMCILDDRSSGLLSEKDIPLFTSHSDNLILNISHDKNLNLNFDILGTIFYILTRSEELHGTNLDEHGRFSARSSHAYKNKYLHRPVVDEYIEILWYCMKKLWPGLERKEHKFNMMLTHDVDEPFESLFRPAWRMVRSFGSDIIRRKDFKRAVTRASLWRKVRNGDWYADRAYTFDRIMDLGESVGCKDAFYFIPDSSGGMSGDYSLDHPALRQLMKHIHDRGHEIGYHGNYDTYLDLDKTVAEVSYLKKIAEEEGITQERWGGRQHYLRWSAQQTWLNYEAAGLDYDATLSFADVAGFRCGTCHPYPVFDVKSRKELELIEYPLTVMECSVLGYMGYTYEQAYDYMMMLKNQCRKYKGTFVFLWHNSAFDDEADWELYKNVLYS